MFLFLQFFQSPLAVERREKNFVTLLSVWLCVSSARWVSMYVSIHVHVPALPQVNAPWAVTCLHHHSTSHEEAARIGDPYSSSRPPPSSASRRPFGSIQ